MNTFLKYSQGCIFVSSVLLNENYRGLWEHCRQNASPMLPETLIPFIELERLYQDILDFPIDRITEFFQYC